MKNKNNESLLVVKGLDKSFNTKQGVVKAIDKVSFTLRPGEIMGLIGESGSGKTTVGRLLIRLYGDFSGYISLDNQIISGKKISKKRNLFLHKNMQMIFQDPHASLDSQQNIYSILKEPLIVNKIMKHEYEDIFTDWKKILKNFKYSFKKQVKEIEYANIKLLNGESKSFIDEWKNEFSKLDFDFNNNNVDNIFNSYFNFLDSRQSKESYYVKQVFLNNKKLFKSYYSCQKDYRNNNLNHYERKMKSSKEKLDLTLELSTQSLNKYLTIKERKKLKEEILDDKKNAKETSLNVKNMLASYLLEYRNTYLSFDQLANKTTNYIEYNNHKKKYLVYKKAYQKLHSSIYKLNNLTVENVDNLISSLDKSVLNLLNMLQQVNIDDANYIEKVKGIISSEFDFRILTFINISAENKEQGNQKIVQKQQVLDEKTQTLKTKSTPHKNDIDILSAEKEYQNTIDEHEWNLKIFLKKFHNEMDLLENDIVQENNINANYKPDIQNLNSEFDKIHNKFKKELSEFSISKGVNKKKIKQLINLYENKVMQKKESLKSFEIEVVNLKSDFSKILHLVGVSESKLSKYFVKKILLKEKIYSALEEVGLLRQFAWRYPHEFSGGQRQRIVIARALISEPKIIIADEPIASLDISIQAQVVNLLKDLCKSKNVALIFIAHDLSMVEYIADNINIMHLGKIVEYGETTKIYSNPIHPYTINLFDSIPKISNANIPFESSNFELGYLDEQKESKDSVEFFKYDEGHYVYATKKQYGNWTGLDVEVNKSKSKTKKNNKSVWNGSEKIEESTIIDVRK